MNEPETITRQEILACLQRTTSTDLDEQIDACRENFVLYRILFEMLDDLKVRFDFSDIIVDESYHVLRPAERDDLFAKLFSGNIQKEDAVVLVNELNTPQSDLYEEWLARLRAADEPVRIRIRERFPALAKKINQPAVLSKKDMFRGLSV
jgi:hypothetical protein